MKVSPGASELYGLPEGASETDPYDQCHGTDKPGAEAEDPGRGSVSLRAVVAPTRRVDPQEHQRGVDHREKVFADGRVTVIQGDRVRGKLQHF